jgi:hypothetical protein
MNWQWRNTVHLQHQLLLLLSILQTPCLTCTGWLLCIRLLLLLLELHWRKQLLLLLTTVHTAALVLLAAVWACRLSAAPAAPLCFAKLCLRLLSAAVMLVLL